MRGGNHENAPCGVKEITSEKQIKTFLILACVVFGIFWVFDYFPTSFQTSTVNGTDVFTKELVLGNNDLSGNYFNSYSKTNPDYYVEFNLSNFTATVNIDVKQYHAATGSWYPLFSGQTSTTDVVVRIFKYGGVYPGSSSSHLSGATIEGIIEWKGTMFNISVTYEGNGTTCITWIGTLFGAVETTIEKSPKLFPQALSIIMLVGGASIISILATLLAIATRKVKETK